MSNSNNSAPATSANLPPTVSLLPGDLQIVLRNLPKEEQGAWIQRAEGQFNSNPSIAGFVFPRRSIDALRENVKNLVGHQNIYDKDRNTVVVLTTVIPKPVGTERERKHRIEMGKMGFIWNPTKQQYEGNLDAFLNAREVIQKLNQ